ncbi:MAG: family 43 glycosylhydrolase [Victivallales bacterium]|nr:family 43 glycosylhydrolase [Victivallales bacterium]
MKLSAIRMRDPFVVPCQAERKYFLFGSVWHGVAPGFYYYAGTDLENWDGPFAAFLPPADFWGPDFFWAPECHEYQGAYYLFGTCGVKATDFRGTQVFRSVTSSPAGPYEQLSQGPLTPRDWKSLDGTLWVEDGQPWLVFCHEWVQIGDGAICAVRLADDLSHAVGEPVELMKASSAPWATKYIDPGVSGWVTDGPFLYREKAEAPLRMLWSSMRNKVYTMGMMVSESGSILGPWRHEPVPIYTQDGGHGMWFRDFTGRAHYILHSPNVGWQGEHPVLLDA